MNKNKQKNLKRVRRHARVRSRVVGTKECPRLSVFKSNTSVYLQIIDDSAMKTLASAHSKEIKEKGTKKEVSFKLGELVAEKAKKLGITKVVFDRGGYKYHGIVKETAEGARKGGLIF